MIVKLENYNLNRRYVVDLIMEGDTSTNVVNVLVLKTDNGTCPA